MEKGLMVFMILGIALMLSGCGKVEVTPDNIPDYVADSGETIWTTISVDHVSYCKLNAIHVVIRNAGTLEKQTLAFPYSFVGRNGCEILGSYGGYVPNGYYAELLCPGTGKPLKEQYNDGQTYYIKMQGVSNSPAVVCDFDKEEYPAAG